MVTIGRIQPNPGALIESLRAFGYSLRTAIADLIDNSISAGSRNIHLTDRKSTRLNSSH